MVVTSRTYPNITVTLPFSQVHGRLLVLLPPDHTETEIVQEKTMYQQGVVLFTLLWIGWFLLRHTQKTGDVVSVKDQSWLILRGTCGFVVINGMILLTAILGEWCMTYMLQVSHVGPTHSISGSYDVLNNSNFRLYDPLPDDPRRMAWNHDLQHIHCDSWFNFTIRCLVTWVTFFLQYSLIAGSVQLVAWFTADVLPKFHTLKYTYSSGYKKKSHILKRKTVHSQMLHYVYNCVSWLLITPALTNGFTDEYTHTHTHTLTYIHTYTHMNMHTHVSTRTYTHTHTSTRTSTRTCIHNLTYTCTHTHVHTCACIYIYMYLIFYISVVHVFTHSYPPPIISIFMILVSFSRRLSIGISTPSYLLGDNGSSLWITMGRWFVISQVQFSFNLYPTCNHSDGGKVIDFRYSVNVAIFSLFDHIYTL